MPTRTLHPTLGNHGIGKILTFLQQLSGHTSSIGLQTQLLTRFAHCVETLDTRARFVGVVLRSCIEGRNRRWDAKMGG